MKVSVVIPVYNTAEYLPKCLDSIIAQSLQDIEIICVDDGSTDSSPNILDVYALRDRRVKVIHKENGGPVSARKVGVLVADGDYIAFVDSDDWIDTNMYEQLYRIAEKNNVEIVTCGFYLEGNYTTIHLDTVPQELYREEKMLWLRDRAIYNLRERSSGLKASLCYKLFKRELIQIAQSKIPDEIVMADDKMCLLTALLDCNSVYVCHTPFYHYRIRSNSIVHTGSEEYLLKVYEVYRYMKKLYCHKSFTKEMHKQSEIYITELLYKGINTLLGFENKNLLWVDPYWMDHIPANAKIVLYGAGDLGKKYRKQIQSRKDIKYVTCVDFAYERLSSDEFLVESPYAILECDYDYVVITVKNSVKEQEIRKKLLDMGISGERIVWFEQPEFFWKFVQAEGLLSD